VRTEPGESGLRVPVEVAEPTGPTATLEIPFDLLSIRNHEPRSVRRWRHAVRDGFRAAFDLGYAVDDFASVTLEHERRCFYLLRLDRVREPPGPPPPG
jgi:predicted GNAT superfamily acetyltransferase